MNAETDYFVFMVAVYYLRILFSVEYYSRSADMIDDLIPT